MTIPQILTDDLKEKIRLYNATNPYHVAFYGAFGNGFSSDSEAIQDGIDNISAAGGGILYSDYPILKYKLDSMIQMKENVELRSSVNTLFEMSASDNMIRLAPNSVIDGGFWNHTSATNTDKSIFHVLADGDVRFSSQDISSIRNVNMRSASANADVAGIYFEAAGLQTAATEAIQWVEVHNVNIRACEWALRFVCHEATDGSSWINGNIFNGVKMDVCKYGIHAEATATGGNPAIAGNQISNFMFQTHDISERAIYLGAGGYIRRWMFNNVMIWDWKDGVGESQEGLPAIESLNNGGSIYGHSFSNVPNLLSTQVDMGPGGFDTFTPALPAS